MNNQISLNKIIALLTLVFLLYSCASVGHNYKYQNTPSLELGKTRSSDYKALFGKPKSVSEMSTSDGTFEVVRYLYSHANMGTARVRLLDLEFRDGLLNAYNHLSSFDKDKTKVNSDQVKQIQRGVTKKAEVLQLLGKPHGIAICPSQHADFKDRCKIGTEVWAWTVAEKLSTFGAAYGGLQLDIKTIFVVFDKDGIVTEVASSHNKRRSATAS